METLQPVAQKLPRVLLRLDDGSIIGSAQNLGIQGATGVVHVSSADAARLGRLSQKDVQRLERLLAEVQREGGLGSARQPELPGPALVQMHPQPVPQPQQQYVQPPLQQQVLAPPMKKQRVEPALQAASMPYDFLTKCKDILSKVHKSMGVHRDAFYKRVDPKTLPDYYLVIKHPIFMIDMDNKLKKHAYQSAQEFADDMRLLWSNVKLYNPIGDPYRATGDRAEMFFEKLWAESGLAGDLGKRATAGIPADRYEPKPTEIPAKPKSASKSQQQQQQQQAAPSARPPSRRTSSKVNGMDRATSHEAKRDEPLSQERVMEIANQLGELPEEQQEELMNLLPPEMLEGAEGEMELDFERLDMPTLKRLDVWLQGLGYPATAAAAAPASPSHISHNPSVRLDADSDEDYDGMSEESDDDM